MEGTSENAATGEPWHAEVPSLDMSTEPAVSLIDEPDSGAAGTAGGLAGIGGDTPQANEPIELPRPLDVEPSDAGIGEGDAAAVEPEPDVPELVPQTHLCGADMSCELKCTSAACAMSCDDANNCKVDCGEESATCDVSCRGANNCEPKCRSGSCELDCTEANNCDHLRCEDGAECLARCTGAGNCEWEECDEPAQCAGDVIVCNRACPTD
jgi:hypothetical protein